MTRTYRCWAVLGVLLIFVFSVSRSDAATMTGDQLVKLMREFEKAQVDFDSANSVQAAGYLGYIMGVFDATEDQYSAPATVTSGRLGEIVAAYLKHHAERWDGPAAQIVIDALTGAFPKGSGPLVTGAPQHR